MREQYHRQIEELLSNYGRIDVLWFDGGETDWLSFGGDWVGAQWKRRSVGQHYRGGFNWGHDEVYAMLRRLQPDVVINGRADMPEDFHSREGWGALGNFDNQKPWELCVPIAGAWGYQPNLKPRPLKDYVQLLVEVAGRDGNLLLNAGPDRNGRIDPLQAERLRGIGGWLRKYGESIYTTRGGPFLPGAWGASTYRQNRVYIHVLKWPEHEDSLVLPPIPAKIVRVTALSGGKAAFVQSNQGVQVSLLPADRDDVDTILAIELDQVADRIGLVGVPAEP